MILERQFRVASPAQLSAESGASRRAAKAIERLHPGYFAFVMATGIISTGTKLMGMAWVSAVLLIVAIVGLALLGTALLLRVIVYRDALLVDLRSPARVFGFFTVIAGLDVVGVRLSAAGHPLLTAIFSGAAALIWLVLTYAVPASIVLRRDGDTVLRAINGSWLIWVVATQSLSIAATSLSSSWTSSAGFFGPLAVALWGIGVVLYLILIAVIVIRWLSIEMTPAELGPPYWILMGATAITVLAGAHILGLPSTTPIYTATAGFVEGATFVLWAFGSWWVPFLLVMGMWRHIRRRWSVAYEPALWSMVFPLGMYSVATFSYGTVTRLDFMLPLGRAVIFIALAVWLAVVGSFVVGLNSGRTRATTSVEL